MASPNLLNRLNTAKNNLDQLPTSPSFHQISGNPQSKAAFSEANAIVLKWMPKVEPLLGQIDDATLLPMVNFTERIVAIVAQADLNPGETFATALRKANEDFRPYLSALRLEVLEALTPEDFLQQKAAALQVIQDSAAKASTELQRTAKDAAEDFQRAKSAASKISVKGAQDEFAAAAKGLRKKATIWTAVTVVLFFGLFVLLGRLLKYPPPLISAIVAALIPQPKQVALPVSVPLLVAASAYYTSIRLALIGVLGIALAFSLRMTKAYFHMIERNQHKSRVTNSIEAFVASVRTDEQKDLVLGKLVDSVTQFGESGILGKESEASLPSVVFEAVTKNVGKS